MPGLFRAPCEPLRPYVSWLVAYDQDLPAGGTHRGLPDTELTFVVPVGQPLDVGWHGDETSRSSYWSCVSGLSTRAAEIRHDGHQAGVQLSLTAAGARALLGVPAAALADTMVGLDDLIGPSAAGLSARLARQRKQAARLDLVEVLLLHRLGSAGATMRDDVAWLVGHIGARRGRVRIASLADELGWSRRHLTTLFRRECGVTPKEFARLARFRASVHQLREPRCDLAAAAAECGFADQSHLTREWRSMTGYAPAEWRRKELPFLQELPVAG